MRTLGRLVLGTLAALCLVWLSMLVYSWLVQHLLSPREWWRSYAALRYGVEVLTFVPFAVAIAIVSRTLFQRSVVASAFACTLVAVAALFIPTAVQSLDLLLPMLRINAEFVLTFIIGAPLAVMALQRWRAARS